VLSEQYLSLTLYEKLHRFYQWTPGAYVEGVVDPNPLVIESEDGRVSLACRAVNDVVSCEFSERNSDQFSGTVQWSAIETAARKRWRAS
jgi:hypothetical protein